MKRGFELYATGWYSVKALANRLAKEGLPAANGGPIPPAHLRRLLASSFYAGFVRWHDMECPGTHPALISRDLFDKVQAVILQRYKNPGANGSVIAGFPLRGLAICASCRGRMTAERHGKFRYYRCSRQTFRRELCSARFCNADRAHAGVERVCRQVKLDRQLAAHIAEAAKTLLAKRAADVAGKRNSLYDEKALLLATEMQLSAAFTAGDLAPNLYNGQIAELRAKRQELAQLAVTTPASSDQVMESVGRTLQVATSFWDLYEPMNESRRSTLLKNVFSTLVLDHEGVAGFTLKTPFAELINGGRGQQPIDLARSILEAA